MALLRSANEIFRENSLILHVKDINSGVLRLHAGLAMLDSHSAQNDKCLTACCSANAFFVQTIPVEL